MKRSVSSDQSHLGLRIGLKFNMDLVLLRLKFRRVAVLKVVNILVERSIMRNVYWVPEVFLYLVRMYTNSTTRYSSHVARNVPKDDSPKKRRFNHYRLVEQSLMIVMMMLVSSYISLVL